MTVIKRWILLQYRYTLLCIAALEAPLQLEINGKTYGDDCVFIANDWHASMVPVYLAAKYRTGGVYQSARAVLAIHNLRHQVLISHGRYTPCSLHYLQPAHAGTCSLDLDIVCKLLTLPGVNGPAAKA